MLHVPRLQAAGRRSSRSSSSSSRSDRRHEHELLGQRRVSHLLYRKLHRPDEGGEVGLRPAPVGLVLAFPQLDKLLYHVLIIRVCHSAQRERSRRHEETFAGIRIVRLVDDFRVLHHHRSISVHCRGVSISINRSRPGELPRLGELRRAAALRSRHTRRHVHPPVQAAAQCAVGIGSSGIAIFRGEHARAVPQVPPRLSLLPLQGREAGHGLLVQHMRLHLLLTELQRVPHVRLRSLLLSKCLYAFLPLSVLLKVSLRHRGLAGSVHEFYPLFVHELQQPVRHHGLPRPRACVQQEVERAPRQHGVLLRPPFHRPLPRLQHLFVGFEIVGI